MKREKLIVSAIAVAAVLGLSACSQTHKRPVPQQQVGSACAQPVQVVRLQKAQYKYVKVRVRTQPARYAKIKMVQPTCALNNN